MLQRTQNMGVNLFFPPSIPQVIDWAIHTESCEQTFLCPGLV